MTSQKTADSDRVWVSSRFVHRLVRGARHLASALIAVGLSATAALPASAARLGFVIGNNDYRPPLTSLTNAANDAADIATELRRAGFTVHDRWVVLNGRRDQMRDAFADFAASVGTGDEVFFFYSGHGVQIDARAALLPVDLRDPTRNPLDGRLRTVTEAAQAEQQVLQESLLLNEVASRIAARAPKFSMLVVDACRDNPVLDLIRRANHGKGATNAGAAGLLIEQESPTQLLFFAAGRGQQALDRLSRDDRSRNGVFTRVFLEEMRKPGVVLRNLVQQTEARVTELAATVRNERGEPHLQTPFSVAKFTFTGDQFRFFGASDGAAGRPASPVDFDQLACDVARSNGGREAWRAYLSEYPSGKCASVARVAIAEPSPTLRPEPQRIGQAFRDCQQAYCPEMIVIPAGRFVMGSSAEEQARAQAADAPKFWTDRESPQREVSVLSFAAGKYAVTKEQFAAFVRAQGYKTEAERGNGCGAPVNSQWEMRADKHWRNVGFAQEYDHPVVCVSWNDAQAYVKWLSQSTGKQYRLLSESEREYAARGGTQTAFWWGDTINTSQANYNGNYSYNGSAKGEYRQTTVPVNSFQPNAFGLYNVHGNVWEWVQDCFEDNYSKGQPIDGSAHRGNDNTCQYRVLRGGSWGLNPHLLRAADRYGDAPGIRLTNLGFRVARTVNP